jgi:hypothetical protein
LNSLVKVAKGSISSSVIVLVLKFPAFLSVSWCTRNKNIEIRKLIFIFLILAYLKKLLNLQKPILCPAYFDTT